MVRPVIVDNAEDVPDYDVECYDDEEKNSKAIQLEILKSLNAKHKEEEKRKQGNSEIKNPFNDIAENEIEKLAKKNLWWRQVYWGNIRRRFEKYERCIHGYH